MKASVRAQFHKPEGLETPHARLVLNHNSLGFEYPLWVPLQKHGFDGVIQHVDVKTELAVYEVPGFVPCAVMSDDASRDFSATMSEHPCGGLQRLPGGIWHKS
jgi:hypothetical protein